MVGTHDITRQTNRRFDSSQNHIYFRYVITSFYITYVPHLHIMFRSFFSLLIIIITMESYFLYIIWMWPFSFPSPAFLLTILYLTLPFVTKIKFKLKALHNLTTAYFFFSLISYPSLVCQLYPDIYLPGKCFISQDSAQTTLLLTLPVDYWVRIFNLLTF